MTEYMLEKKKTQLTIIVGILVVVLVLGLYVGIFKTPETPSLGKTEYGVCLHLHQFNSSTTLQLIKQLNATNVRIVWIQNS